MQIFTFCQNQVGQKNVIIQITADRKTLTCNIESSGVYLFGFDVYFYFDLQSDKLKRDCLT